MVEKVACLKAARRGFAESAVGFCRFHIDFAVEDRSIVLASPDLTFKIPRGMNSSDQTVSRPITLTHSFSTPNPRCYQLA